MIFKYFSGFRSFFFGSGKSTTEPPTNVTIQNKEEKAISSTLGVTSNNEMDFADVITAKFKDSTVAQEDLPTTKSNNASNVSFETTTVNAPVRGRYDNIILAAAADGKNSDADIGTQIPVTVTIKSHGDGDNSGTFVEDKTTTPGGGLINLFSYFNKKEKNETIDNDSIKNPKLLNAENKFGVSTKDPFHLEDINVDKNLSKKDGEVIPLSKREVSGDREVVTNGFYILNNNHIEN